MKQAGAFLAKKDKVKINLVFTGREMSFKDQWKAVLDKIVLKAAEHGVIERTPLTEGRIISMVFAPKADK
jgi:translation initiation factor IF-3